MGNFFLRQNQHIEAARCYETAIKKEPGFTDAYYNLAWILYKARAYDESLKYVSEGLNTESDHTDLQELKNKLQVVL
ncbi:hypothetical protein BH23BAC3_BH23BAC3_12020 [soil metagenome]